MLLTVRMEQWRVHRLARSVPSDQRTPQSTSGSRECTVAQQSLGQFLADDCLGGSFQDIKTKNTDKIGSTFGPFGPFGPFGSYQWRQCRGSWALVASVGLSVATGPELHTEAVLRPDLSVPSVPSVTSVATSGASVVGRGRWWRRWRCQW